VAARPLHWEKLLLWRRPSQVGTYVEGHVVQPYQSCKTRIEQSSEPASSPLQYRARSFADIVLFSSVPRKPPQPSLKDDGGFRRSDMPCHSPHVSPTWPEQLPRRPFTQCDVHACEPACLPTYSTCNQQHTLHDIVQGAPRSTPARPPPKTSQPTQCFTHIAATKPVYSVISRHLSPLGRCRLPVTTD
jgi:hypothetical protein